MKSLLVAGALALCAASAQAADMSYPSLLSAEPAYDWSGFYAGVHVGGGVGEAAIDGGTMNTQHLGGALAGVQAGYRRQFGRYVLGAEASLSGMTFHGTQTCTNPSFTCTANYHSVATVEGLAGVAFGRTLLFAKGGAAYLSADADVDPTYPGHSASTWGYAIGVGAEYAVTDKISVRADYSYMKFSTVTAPAGTLASSAQTADPVAHVFRIGANYNF